MVEFGANYRFEPCQAGRVEQEVRTYLYEVAATWPEVPTWVMTTLPYTEVLVYNTGAAFSMGEGRGTLFVLICAVICAGCCVLAWRERDMPPALLVTLGCICGGGIGNAIDRVMAGRVTDFFATTFMDFAVFNVADVFITCGVILAFILWCRWDAKREGDASSD